MKNEEKKPLRVLRLPLRFRVMGDEQLKEIAQSHNTGSSSFKDHNNFFGATKELERRGYKISGVRKLKFRKPKTARKVT